jgi:Uma2 family endonuclease
VTTALSQKLVRQKTNGRSECWDGADLVMEVVSDKNSPHHINKKPLEYGKAGIPEYWIVDAKKGDDHGPRP